MYTWQTKEREIMLKYILLTIWCCCLFFGVANKIGKTYTVDNSTLWFGVPIQLGIWLSFIYWFSL